jgi:hypothetical protein
MSDKIKKYTFYFLDGVQSVGVGTSVSKAFANAGYGGGAINVVDFWEEGDHIAHIWNKSKKCWETNSEVSM